MKRILHEVASLDAGGVERLLLDYYRHFSSGNIAFDFVIFEGGQPGIFEQPLLDMGCRIYRVPRVHGFGTETMRALWKILKEGSYQVVHTHRGSRGVLVMALARFAGVPVRIAHAHIAYEQEKSTLHKWKTTLLKRLCALFATDLFACGEDAARYMWGERALGRVRFMRNAIDLERFEAAQKDAGAIRKSLQLGNRLVLGTVARLDRQKNPTFLIELCQKLLKMGLEPAMLIVGGGPMEEELRSLARERGVEKEVRFLGVRRDVPQLLAAMDLFLLPSLFEGLPVVLLEAQASGLHCLASTNVTREVNVTGNVEFLPLEVEKWAEWIAAYVPSVDRSLGVQLLRAAGYDIVTQARELEEYYVRRLREVDHSKEGNENL